MITGSGQGFGELGGSEMRRVGQFGSGGQPPMPGPAHFMGGGSVGIRPAQHIEAPTGPPPNSPLGMWQNWLKTMGPYLAQMPSSMPNQESGGLSSLAPSQATPGTMKGYWGGDGGWEGRRGFNALRM